MRHKHDTTAVEPWKVEMGRRIAAAREKLALNQTEFGRRCGVTQATVSGWETGAHQMTVATLKAVVELTGEPSSYFVPEALRRRDSIEALALTLSGRVSYDHLAALVAMPETELQKGLDAMIGAWTVELRRSRRLK